MARRVKLAVIMGHTPCQHSIGAWRAGNAFPRHTYAVPEFWEDIATTLERGGIEFLLLADQYAAYDVFRNSSRAAIQNAVQFPLHDPVPLIPIISRVTENLGIGVTLSSTYLPPYHIARTLSTLDHLTHGRVAWNIVTSYGKSAAGAFGLPGELPKSQRYERAEECVEICKSLWHSWDSDALVGDKASGEYVRAAAVRSVHYQGRHLSLDSVFSVPPMGHGSPVLIQAGASEGGLGLAARHAEIYFATAGDANGMRSRIDRLAKMAYGFRRHCPKVFWGASVVLGKSHDEAVEKDARLKEMVPLEGSLAQMSGDLGVDLSEVPLDTKIAELSVQKEHAVEGIWAMVGEKFGDLTLRELAPLYGVGMGGLRFVGSAQEVAEAMIGTLDQGGGEGFLLRCSVLPQSLYDVKDLLVPELRRRGCYGDYTSNILRERIGTS